MRKLLVFAASLCLNLSAVEIQSGIIVTPQPAVANQRVDFSAVATGTGTLTYTWSIGGLTIVGQSVFASYFEAGAYVAKLTVTDSTGASAERLFRVYITTPTFDEDLDGVPGKLETALGSNALDVNSKAVTAQRERLVFTPKPVKIAADPNKADADSISATFVYERDTTAAPTTMAFWVSGVVKVFDISVSRKRFIATPRSGSRNDKLTLKQKDGLLTATVTFKKGSFLSEIDRNSIRNIQGTKVIDIYSTIDGNMYGLNINLAVTTASSGKVKATGSDEAVLPRR
ncbi:MAG TPA: PKD domain-containing protein [Planctomycetota bacterium]|nr:PKD domain-containing protein [Planctomycetota bacterium]